MEQIFKLQPDRCLALRGFDTFAASAALHSATPSSFGVSGTFRDPADFCVVMLWDADNYYEHPTTKYLPDFNFAGLVLNFDLLYNDGVQPIDSPKFNWIDWATLDCVLANGQTSRIKLWDYATLNSGSFTPASGSFQLTAGSNGPLTGDSLTIFFENVGYQYTVPAVTNTAGFSFYGGTPGAIHSITVNTATYSYTEPIPNGDSGAGVAAALIAQVNANAGDPDVVASAGSATNGVTLTMRTAPADVTAAVSATDGNGQVTLGIVTLASITAALAAEINNTSWTANNSGQAILASTTGATLNIQAARYGYVNTSGTTVTWSPGPPQNGPGGAVTYGWSEKFPGIQPGDLLSINQTPVIVSSCDSPTQITLATPLQNDVQNAVYTAARGGRDGNLFTLYSLAQPASGSTPNFNTTQSVVQLSGGSSACTWNVRIDFTALAIDQLRQCWLTFAPSLTNGSAYSATNWLATFTNWNVTGPDAARLLKVAGPGTVRIEETSTACKFVGQGWIAAPGETGFYSAYAAAAAYNKISQTNSSGQPELVSVTNSVTIQYNSAVVHNLYVGTSLYTDRGVVDINLDGVAQPSLNCYLNTGSAVVTRRVIASNVPAGQHSVVLTLETDTNTTAALFYFDFLEAACLSDFQPLSKTFKRISPALDYDTDHTYKLSPARLMWVFDQLGFAGPVNEYLGVFWWNQRSPQGGVFPQTAVTFGGVWLPGDTVILAFLGGEAIGKTVFPGDTPTTIAAHFADYVNTVSTSAWASAASGVLTITSRSPASGYELGVSLASGSPTLTTGSTGTVALGPAPLAGVLQTWVIDPTIQPVLNQSISDWHADFYAECAKRSLDVTTAGSMELVLPPSGFAAIFPDSHQTPVTTSTGFGTLSSTQCAVGGSQVVAYQKQFYRAIAALQTAAGLTPAVQYGEFLWWFFNGPADANGKLVPDGGMAYYDSETTAAAQASLGRPLVIFKTQNDSPTINSSADATFLRNRLRDHVAALSTDLHGAYPNVKVEVLFPYDVNYPQPITPGNALGGQLNRFVNLPVEWEQQSTSGLDRMKVEALQFATQFRNLDLATQAVALMPDFGWPRNLVRYLVPVFGTFIPWQTESGLAFSQNLNAVTLWAFDHICLLNLSITNLREP